MDELLETLPIWPRMHATVKPLIDFGDRSANGSARSVWLKEKQGAA
jgi:regulator of sigma D